jgi:hypothetical protein
MGKPLHRFLEEFASDEAHSSAIVRSLRPRVVERIAAPDPLTLKLQEAYDLGRTDGETSARSAIASDQAALVADCERKIETVKSVFTGTIADDIARELREGLAEAGGSIAEKVAAILLPLLRDRLTELAIRSFADDLRCMAEDTLSSVIELSGPDELVERLLLHFDREPAWRAGRAGPEIRLVTSSHPELRVVMDRSVLQTRLAEWLERIEEAMR